ncbi:MAG: hypothetical protein GX939_05315 [Clostridiaceae bacterium]|jgi:hypothetical protein|nr:hypothetical protein [Clostridiaceae bacterium]
MTEEPEMMMTEVVDEDAIRKRAEDTFFINTSSILAIDNSNVAGRTIR